MTSKDFVTQEGLEKIDREIAELEERLACTRHEKGEAAQMGNVWHDNFAFESLEQQERMLVKQLTEKKAFRHRAQVVNASPAAVSVIEIGSTAELQFEDGTVMTLTIRGTGEGDPTNGVISYQSPVGKAILGAIEGEERIYHAGGRERCVIILKILR